MPMPCMDNKLWHQKECTLVRFTPLLDVSATYASARPDETGKYDRIDYMSLSTNNPASGRDLDEAGATQVVIVRFVINSDIRDTEPTNIGPRESAPFKKIRRQQ